MRKHLLKFCFIFILASIAVGVSCSNRARAKEEQGATIIEKIEKFKTEEGRTPRSLTEIGIAESEEGPIYYKPLGGNHYQLWYGTKLGESVIYDSERKTWK